MVFVQQNLPKKKRCTCRVVVCLSFASVLVAVAVVQLLKGDKHERRFATTIFSATQRCNIVATLFRIVATLFHIATLCCAKNRRCESFRVTPP